MNDLIPHQHGDEGGGSTHYACKERIERFEEMTPCCACTGHKCREEQLEASCCNLGGEEK